MTRETSNKFSKREINNKGKKREDLSHRKKIIESSDSDSDDSDSDYEDCSDEEEIDDELDVHEYRKFLSKMFPSRHLNKKIESGEKLKEALDEDDDEEYDDDDEDYTPEDEDEESSSSEEEVKKKKCKKVTSNNLKSNKKNEIKKNLKKEIKNEIVDKKSKKDNKKRKLIEESETEEEDDEEEIVKKSNSGKFNIIFTIGKSKSLDDSEDDDDDSEYSDESDDDDGETENEDDSVSSTSSTEIDEDEDDEEEEENLQRLKRNFKKEKNEKNTKNKIVQKKELLEDGEINENEIIEEYENNNELNKKEKSEEELNEDNIVLEQLKEIYSKNKNNKMIKECLKVCEDNLKEMKKKDDKKREKHKKKNARIFKKILHNKNSMNDYNFFNTLAVDEQKKIIKELREINKIIRIETPYRITLLESNIPSIFKAAAMKKINSLRYMEPGSGEYYKIKNWVDTFMRIPFGKFETLPVNISDGVERCHEFMDNAKQILDKAAFGLNDAKMQIMQMLGQLVTNPDAIGSAIAIQGPMGTGKTTLVKEGISKILNRPFAFIALGGATDSSFLEGHSYTYEGSIWGKIVQILIDSKCMNPVIYFDELDKISDTPKGEEIAGILTHLTDTSQNSEFHDKYFAEINFDLSKCLFIFSYNDESKINPILKDRMYKIHTKGYDKKEKSIISNQYLLPKIREQVMFKDEDIIIPDESINYIIENFCNKEDGVRNMKRCLEIIYTKLNLYRLMKPGSNLFEKDMSLEVQFPYTVTKNIVDKLIKISGRNDDMAIRGMYI